MKKRLGVISVILLASGALAACGGDKSADSDAGKQPANTDQKPAEKPLEPVTLMLYPGQWITPADMELMINGPLQKKYPHIKVEVINRDGNPIENHLATGGQMDLITSWNGSMANNMTLDVYEELTPYMQKFGFDVNRFDPSAINTIREIAEDKKLYGLPYNRQFNALYYNKDIFDKFGVPYPKDGMTWEDAIELAKKVTREEGGIQYRGLDPESVSRMGFPLSLHLVDAATNKVLVTGEQYRKVFELTKSIYDIPGNRPEKWGSNTYDAFIKDKTVAMSAHVNLLPYLAEVEPFNWDMVQYPSYKEQPNVYGMFDMHIIGISKTSKYKDDAFRVLEVLFSDDVQLVATKQTGRVSLLKDPKFQEAFGAEMPVLQGKHKEAIFMSKPAPAPRLSPYYSKAGSILRNHFYQYADGAKDVNTALRDAEEEITQHINSQLGK